jgi:glycosyltransferase involved in cell wall biosynthesis
MNKTKLRVGLISSYVPKKCGIATYSRDLIDAMGLSEKFDWCLVAAEDSKDEYSYGKKAIAVIKKDNQDSYIKAAEALNKWQPDVVLLEHEYGLFGGDSAEINYAGKIHHAPTGNYILSLLDNISAPVVTTLHTVIPKSDRARADVLHAISNRSAKIITMTRNAKHVLHQNYNINSKHVAVIPHGVPRPNRNKRSVVCSELGLDCNRYYLLVTGLIGPNKGIDTIIKALPKIIRLHPQIMLLVVGQTHPNILTFEGEKYRNSLTKLARELNVSDYLHFVNEYLPTDKLVNYFTIADVYLTIHKDAGQSASGTLAYALGCGLVAISTPYRYAEEVLAGSRGILVPFDLSSAISKQVNELIENPELSERIRARAKTYGATMNWKKVGKTYLKLLKDVIE